MTSDHDTSAIEASVKVVAEPWRASAYYEDAERWTFLFWDEGTLFRTMFDRLALDKVVELACGHGRHAERIADRAGELVLLDVFPANLETSRERLGERRNVGYVDGDGYTFRPIADGSVSAIFCYDAMVHFSPDIVRSYLMDAARVLRPGGRALFHHSNYAATDDRHYGLNPHARNHMTFALFTGYCAEAGLTILESVTMDWGDVADLDRLSLLERPA